MKNRLGGRLRSRWSGSAGIIPDESDDLWLAYNLILPGDTVMVDTTSFFGWFIEKVQEKQSLGSRKKGSVDYDKEGSELRIHGKNILENEHVKVDPSASADLAVVLMEEGLANILFVGKRLLNKFYEKFYIISTFKSVRCAVIASPGFTKDQFHRHLMLEAERRDLRNIIENKSRIILVHSTSGYKHSLIEVLNAPTVMNLIKDTKAAQEVDIRLRLNEFFAMLRYVKDQHRACYGPKHVEVANERMAVETLLITDELFRIADIATRQRYVNLVNGVEKSGGTTYVFSSMHVSGEQLAQMTGVAATLRLPLPDLDDIEM
ncbi:protein PELOTA 1 [Tanacetum coccineum]